MSDNTGEAAELAERAAKQGRNAVKNTGRAAKAVAEPVLEHVVDEFEDTAKKLEGTLDDAIQKTNRRALRRVTVDVGAGAVALLVSAYAGKLAFNKFVYAIGYARGTASAVADVRQGTE